MSEWISLEEISNDLGISKRTISYYKDTQDFPPVYRFGKRHLRVKSIDYEAWKKTKILKNPIVQGPKIEELENEKL